MNLATDPAGPNGAAPPPLPIASAELLPGQPGTAPRATPRDFEIFELPAAVPVKQRAITLRGQRFAILEVWLALLTAEEDKRATAKAGNYASNALILAKLLTVEALRYMRLAPITMTLGDDGNPAETWNAANAVDYAVAGHDGTAEGAYAAMHPALRDALVLAYSEATSMDPEALVGFIKSRRPGTR